MSYHFRKDSPSAVLSSKLKTGYYSVTPNYEIPEEMSRGLFEKR